MLANEPSITAKICAFVRAHHSNYANDKIFDDYLAYDLLGKNEYEKIKHTIIKLLTDKSWQIPRLETWNNFINDYISPIILSRVKYAEESLLLYAKENESIQYVICGAGLDSFAFRNTNSNIKVFELDHPNTHNYKKERINKLGWITPDNAKMIAIDFEKEKLKEVLLKAGFDPKVKSFFSILGVTYYLPLEILENTIWHISELSEYESIIILDYPEQYMDDRASKRMKLLMDLTDSLGEKMTNGVATIELRAMLERHNYCVLQHFTPDIIQKTYFHAREDGIKAFENVNFIKAEKSQKRE